MLDGVGLTRAGEQPEGLVSQGEVGKEGEFQKGVGSEVITGLDAVGLYPSIKKGLAMRICREVAEETEVEIDHMNLLEATRFLVLTWPKDRVETSEIKRYLPVRKQVEGKKIGTLGLTTKNSLGATPNDQSQWTWPKVKVPTKIKKKIFSYVVEEYVKIFYETQTYTWGGGNLPSRRWIAYRAKRH